MVWGDEEEEDQEEEENKWRDGSFCFIHKNVVEFLFLLLLSVQFVSNASSLLSSALPPILRIVPPLFLSFFISLTQPISIFLSTSLIISHIPLFSVSLNPSRLVSLHSSPPLLFTSLPLVQPCPLYL